MKSSFHGCPKESGMIHGGKASVPRELTATMGQTMPKVKAVMAKSQTEGGAATKGPKMGKKPYNQE